MGTYIHTFKKKFNKKVTIDGNPVVVGQATFLCRQDWSGNYSPSEKREMTRAYALTKNDQPEYITFDGEMVYKNNKKVINLANRVEKQSNLYKKQLLECQSKFNKNKYIIF